MPHLGWSTMRLMSRVFIMLSETHLPWGSWRNWPNPRCWETPNPRPDRPGRSREEPEQHAWWTCRVKMNSRSTWCFVCCITPTGRFWKELGEDHRITQRNALFVMNDCRKSVVMPTYKVMFRARKHTAKKKTFFFNLVHSRDLKRYSRQLVHSVSIWRDIHSFKNAKIFILTSGTSMRLYNSISRAGFHESFC